MPSLRNSIKPSNIIDKHNIRRKVANRPEYERIDMKIYEYKKANVSINKINQFVQGVVSQLINKGFDVKVNTTIKTPLSWKSGRLTENASPIRVWTPAWGTDDKNGDELMDWYDDGEGIVEDFDLFVQVSPRHDREEGGRDENNDCLYNCLYSLLKDTLKAKWVYPSQLKRFLHIKRDSMINSLEHIDRIESYLNIGIFIEGDVKRTPKIKSKTSISIILTDQHFSVKKVTPKERRAHKVFTSFEEKSPIFYHKDKSSEAFHFYDGEVTKTESTEQFLKRFANRYESKYFYMKCAKKEELKDMHNEFVQNADGLKDATKGRINMYKTHSIKNTALKLFYDMIQHIGDASGVDDNEAEFILGCYRGGLLYHNKGYKGPAWKGDVCSMYPSLMASKLMYPYKKGEFKTISQEDLLNMKDNRTGNQIFKAGIYRACVTGLSKLFQQNKKNYYTHIDMMQAYFLKLNITMIEDGKANFLYYSPDKMLNGSMLFSHYVDYMFKLKKENQSLKFAKRILNILWGALCETKTSGKYTLKVDAENQATICCLIMLAL